MEQHICPCCGGGLQKNGDTYHCPYCRADFEDDFEERAAMSLRSLLDEERMESLQKARRALFMAAHERFPSNDTVLSCARKVREIYPADDYALLYEASITKDPQKLNDFLLRSDMDIPLARECFRWVIASLEARNSAALKTMVQRYFAGEEALDMMTEIEAEDAKISDGLYIPSLPRDVFLAYSSADQDQVVRTLDLLEENGFTVFAAFRNLRHGKGAADNYLASLQEAMKHCKILVFLSSSSSRNLACDALRVELPFINDNLPEMKRIEYVIEPYDNKTPMAAKILLKRVFEGLEWCQSEEDLLTRLLTYTTVKEKKKFASIACPVCGREVPIGTRFCPNCGHSFVQTEEPKPKPEPEAPRQKREEPRQQSNPQQGSQDPSLRNGFGRLFGALGTAIGRKVGQLGDRVMEGRAAKKGRLSYAPVPEASFVLLQPRHMVIKDTPQGPMLKGLRGVRAPYIAIPPSIRVIHGKAFRGYERVIKGILFPDSIEEFASDWGDFACMGLPLLEYVYLPVDDYFRWPYLFDQCFSKENRALVVEISSNGSVPPVERVESNRAIPYFRSFRPYDPKGRPTVHLFVNGEEVDLSPDHIRDRLK